MDAAVSRKPGVPRTVLLWGFAALLIWLAVFAVILLAEGPGLAR